MPVVVDREVALFHAGMERQGLSQGSHVPEKWSRRKSNPGISLARRALSQLSYSPRNLFFALWSRQVMAYDYDRRATEYGVGFAWDSPEGVKRIEGEAATGSGQPAF